MRTLFLLIILAITNSAIAEVLPEDDNGPLTGLFGLPGIEEGGAVLADGRIRTSLSVFTASHAIVEEAGDESLILDGETIRTQLDVRYGLRPGFEIGLELPYVMHQAGNLDSLIDSWHDIFGLPEGTRDDRPNDILDFSYSDASGNVLSFDQRAQGIGDIRLYAGLDLSSGDNHKRALRVGVKLPTGDADELLGSGGTDLSIGFAGDVVRAGGNDAFSVFYRANVTYIGKPERFAGRYRDFVGQFSAGLSYTLHPRFDLNVQSTLRTAIYESEIEKFGEPALTLAFGGTIGLSQRLKLALGVTEDIKVNSAPDVTFNVAIRYRP